MVVDQESSTPSKKPRKKRVRSNPETWKSAEREIAKRLGDGAERIPVTGRTLGSAPDIKHPSMSLEVKHGKSIPVFFSSAMRQAQAAVRGDQFPVVVFHPHGWKYDDCLVMVRLCDLPKLRANGHPTDG